MTASKEFKPLKVAVIGGGPGGLATAIALQKVPGVEVTVYEQAKVLREVGAGISIGRNSWTVLDLLGIADAVDTGHPTSTVLQFNGKTGEELSRVDKPIAPVTFPSVASTRQSIRTQRTKLQSALRSHVPDKILKLDKKLTLIKDLGADGISLNFADGTKTIADLVVGADGIRSVVRDAAWPEYQLKFTGTTIWRVLLPWDAVKDLDRRFETTAWWHGPTTHVYFSPVGEGLWEIAARAWQDPEIHGASKVSWGTPVDNETVEANFGEYFSPIREALHRVPDGKWREFAAFAGPELSTLTAWDNKIVLVGDSSHALSGAFGSGAGFAMEDGWVLAEALRWTGNDLDHALPIFERIRLPYYSRMYEHLNSQAVQRKQELSFIANPSYDQRVRNKILKIGGADMSWIYENNIGEVWRQSVTASA